MKVQELLMNIRNKDFKLERGLEIKKYLPIEVKKTIAQAIIYECTSDEDGVVKVDSLQRYMSYVKYMIKMHTNLEYTDDDYDALCSTEYGESTLLNAIMKCFETDATECSRILNLMTDDFVYEHSVDNAVGQFLYGLNNIIGSISKTINEKVNDFNLQEMLSKDFDLKSIGDFLTTYVK